MRSNPVYYIFPSNISITANANGNVDDLAVYIAEETKIKVYSDKHPELAPTDGGYLEWFLTGRNRRLRYSDRPYTIYARLNRNNITDGYLVFAPQEQHNGVWCDPYSTVTNDGNGYSILYIDEETGSKMQTISPTYWYIKLGTVSLPVNNQRALENFDTGILGTDQYNVEWQTNPDQMPLRVEITNSRDNYAWTKKRPYVEWDKTITLDARLLRGWAEDAAALVHHWEIARDTGDANAAADAAWNDIDRSGGFGQSGHIVLSHESGEFDDFSAAVSATFTITAYGVEETSDSSSSDSSSSSSDEPAIVALASASITIDAETVEKYGLSLSSNVMHYDGSDYAPAAGITICIRGKAEDGTVHILTQSEIEQALLSAYYNPVDATDSSHDVPLVFSNGRAIVSTTAFAAEKSINVHLMYGASDDSSSSDSDSSSSSSDEPSTGTEIDTAAIGYVRDGDKGDPGVSYRCVWLLGSTEVPSLAADSDGALKNLPTQSPSLTVKLMKREGDEAESVVVGSGTVVIAASGGSWSSNITDGNFQKSLELSGSTLSYINSLYVMQLSATFAITGGETFTFTIDKVMDGDDGAPAAHLEMDNYESTVIIDADGGVAQSIPLNYARFYVGNEPVTPTWGMSISGGGGTHAGWNIVATGTEAVRTLMFVNSLSTPIASEGVYTVEVTATHNGESYVAKWTINVVRETISYSIEAEPGMFIYNETKEAWDVPSIALHIVRMGSYSGRRFLNDVPSGYTFGARWNGVSATVNHSPLSMTWTLSPKGCYDSSGNIVGHVVYLTKTGYSLELEIPTYVRNDAVLRPREWVTGAEVKYYSGVEGEDFRDVIAYNDGNGNVTWYSCVATTDDDFEPEDGETPADYPAYFTESDGQFEFVATNLLLAQMAYIKNLGVQYLRMGGWPSGETAPAGYEPQAGAIEMYDLEGENVLFRVKDGQVEANTGTFNNVRVNGTVNAVTGSFSGHIKSVPTIIHEHNIEKFINIEINPFTGRAQFMLDVEMLGRNSIFFVTSSAGGIVPSVVTGSSTVSLEPTGYGKIQSLLERIKNEYRMDDSSMGLILPYTYGHYTDSHFLSDIVIQFGYNDETHTSDSTIGLNNLYKYWLWHDKGWSVMAAQNATRPLTKPDDMPQEDWDDWGIAPFRIYEEMTQRSRDYVDSEVTIAILAGSADISAINVYGVKPIGGTEYPYDILSIGGGTQYNTHSFKCEQDSETINILWDYTNASIPFWDRYTLGLEDWPEGSSSDSSSSD